MILSKKIFLKKNSYFLIINEIVSKYIKLNNPQKIEAKNIVVKVNRNTEREFILEKNIGVDSIWSIAHRKLIMKKETKKPLL